MNSAMRTSSQLQCVAGRAHLCTPLQRVLLLLQAQSSILASFTADPPTTTMQRVKALLTGSLPTFLDVGTVFAGAQIEEDNVFFQAMRHGKRVGCVGDDTWTQLFPPQSNVALNISLPFPSLNVKDLHTVDDGVAQVRSANA